MVGVSGRTSARNDGWVLVATNIAAYFNQRHLRKYTSPQYRWGSILGVWDTDGMELFWQNGMSFTTAPGIWAALWPLVQRFLWGGMRNTVKWELLVVGDEEQARHKANWEKRRQWWLQLALLCVALLLMITWYLHA